jgi:hypothetical protein
LTLPPLTLTPPSAVTFKACEPLMLTLPLPAVVAICCRCHSLLQVHRVLRLLDGIGNWS